MSDCTWGFDRTYGHKTTPSKWSRSNGFRSFDQAPFPQKSFRRREIPAYRPELRPLSTDYKERPQSSLRVQGASPVPAFMSAYGCHRQVQFATWLRSPRNPGSGLGASEMRYKRQDFPEGAAEQMAASPAAKDGPGGHSVSARPPLQEHYRRWCVSSMSYHPASPRAAEESSRRDRAAPTVCRPSASPPGSLTPRPQSVAAGRGQSGNGGAVPRAPNRAGAVAASAATPRSRPATVPNAHPALISRPKTQRASLATTPRGSPT